MSLLTIIRQKLLDDSVGGSDWPVFIGYTPDDPGVDQIIGLQLSGGTADETMLGENVYETFQLKVRAGRLEFADCESKWREAFDSLHDASISGISLIQALATGPMPWYDEKSRICMSANFRVVRPRP